MIGSNNLLEEGGVTFFGPARTAVFKYQWKEASPDRSGGTSACTTGGERDGFYDPYGLVLGYYDSYLRSTVSSPTFRVPKKT